MRSLARRIVAQLVCAAMLAAQWPAAAWAGAGGAPGATSGASSGAPEPNAAEALKYLRSMGVYKDDADPLKTYLGTDNQLTPIGRILYLSLQARYNPAEEVESMKPIFDRLRGNGTYTPARQDGAARAMKIFTEKFGALDQAPAGSIEESFRLGGMREALMTGAAISDPPKAGAFAQVEVKDGYEFWDADGLAFRMTKNQVTTYNRELQKTQRQMNLNRPPEVAAIPETGRYNYEMLQYSYWRLRNQEKEYIKATRIDRMIALAELLGKQYPTDMWFNEKGLEDDLIREAKAKTYEHRGETYSVYDIIEAKFTQRRAYLEGSRAAVARFETDMNRFKASNTITDSQVATMSLDEQNALRWLSLTVLETQMFHVRNQRERVDPTSPDAQAIMKMVDESAMTNEQKVHYKEQGRRMKERLDQLRAILDTTRKALNNADYAGSLDSVQAALAATQKELGDLSIDYSIYLEAPSTAFLAKSQTLSSGGLNPFHHLYNGVSTVIRGGYKMTPWGKEYASDMKVIEGDGKTAGLEKQFTDIAGLISNGRKEDWAEARRRIMAMNPNATQYSMAGTPGSDPPKVNDALRISASLKTTHDRINAVMETNKTLDAAATFVTWTVSIALLAPIARASLNLVGKLSGVGVNMINAGIEIGGARGLAARAVGRSLMIVGEIAKHTAARLESLEPDAGRIKAVAGENAAAQYLLASGARALSVATRQATFTAMSAGISAGFTAGTHLYDMATKNGVKIGGWQMIEPSHSMFSEDWDGVKKAAWAGFKGGAWWANEGFHPALGYIGLPSTVFGGTRLAGVMETIGTRGVVGSASIGMRTLFNGSAAVEAAAASGRVGFLERLSAAKWYTGGPVAAFGLSMADNVAKYALFSQAAGFLGQKYAWYVDTNVPITIPFLGVVNHPEEDIERRIKRSNETGKAWLESPAWLLIPTYGAHGARDAGPYMMTKEGMRQYDEAGRTKEYANAPEGTVLKLEPVKPPLSQRLFEAHFFGEKPASEWTVTKQAKEAGQLKEVTRLANEGGLVNPIELMAVRDLTAGKDTFRTLHVTEEVQKTAYEVATEGLVSQPKKSMEALTVEPGRTVKGWGEITPETQIEIAKALYRAEVNLGKKLPPELHSKVREVLKDHLQANLPIGEAGKVLRAAVVDLAVDQPNLDKAQKEAIEAVLDWEAAPAKGKPSYLELTLSLREKAEAKLKAGELSAKEAKALTALYDYIITGDKRFNSFNKTEGVKARADVIFNALRVKYAERPEMLRLVENYRSEVSRWADANKGKAAEGDTVPRESRLSILIDRLQQDLKQKLEKAPGKLGPSEGAALDKALGSVKASAWVVRDAKGGAIPGWRPKQYVRLMQSFLGEGSLVKAVKSASEGLFEAARGENEGRPKLLSAIGGVEADVNAWIKSREAAGPKGEESGMGPLLDKLQARLKDSAADLTPKEGAALSGLVDAIAGMEREGMHKGILSSGRKGNDVQLFVKAPTSLGKTLLAYEGLLPYLEAEAAASKRKVMFLTFNTKLQAQAEFDFLAFNKLGSEVKFETYEGLKTMIAEGKTKGRNVVEDYLMLQDEMDAAGQQPALTIGMVSGRVSKLNGQTAALNDSNAGIAWAMSRLNTIRVEAAEVQAQHIHQVVEGISDAHVERARIGELKTAADDVLEAVGQLKRAKGAEEIRLAENAIEAGMSRLRSLSGGLPGSESEAANTIQGALGRMKDALAERPSANPEVRSRLAAEMETAFLNQNRLMNLTNTVEGLERLPAEAKKARMALEAKIESLGKDLAEAEASGGRDAARRASLLREQLESARVEKAMVERFDGVDASARLISLDEQISAIRSGLKPAERLSVNPKLARLMRESIELEAKGTPEATAKKAVVDGRLDQLLKSMGSSDAAALKDYRAEIGRALKYENEIGETKTAIKEAKKLKQPTDALEARLTELEAGRAASKGELRKLETSLGAVKSTPKLDALVREAESLEAGMSADRRAAHQEYRTLLGKIDELSAKMGESEGANRAAIESERATVRGRLRALELDLSASPAKGDLGGTLRRIQVLSAEAGRLERRITAAEAKGERAGGLKSELKKLRSEETALRREARTEIIKRFDDAGADIVKLTREGKPGWDAEVNRLLERRRALQEAYAGDESALYTAYREMKENARPIGEDPRLTEKPYEVPGGEGLEPTAVLRRADFLIERAREVEAKGKGKDAGPLEQRLVKARAELEALSAAKDSPEFFDAVDRLRTLELELLRADSFHTADLLLHKIDGDSFLGFLPRLPKFLIQALTGRLTAPTEAMGLTRYHAVKMLEALAKDPMMPAHQRDNLMWSYLGSMLFPKGIMGKGSYVRGEIINMVQGFHDSAAGVRVDNRTGRFNVVHNGQWFESMDNASRRWWELEYGTDLTLPYTHNSMSTIKDVTTNKKSYFISLSGTSGAKFEAHLRNNKISIVGEGSATPKNVLLEVVATPEQRFARVAQSLEAVKTATADHVVLRVTDQIPAEAKKGIDEYLSARGMKLGDPQVIKISEVGGEAAQKWLRGVRSTQKNTGLIVLSVPDTRVLRNVETYLKKAGIAQNEIAKVFADTEYLRLNVPEADVLSQMNIEGLNTGKVKVLILDARVGGRGLDLNFKGERNSTRTDAFRGYTNFEMFILRPEENSGVQTTQVFGRIDTGRTLSGAPRKFSLLLDIETAGGESVFKSMFESDPFFVEMRKDPAFQEFVRKKGGAINWTTANEYFSMRAQDGTGEGALLAQRAEKAVRENLSRRNLEVEENLLRSSNVLTDAPTTAGKHPALERIR